MGAAAPRAKKKPASITGSVTVFNLRKSLKQYLYGNFMCCTAELIHYALHKFPINVLGRDFSA
jgi:hypothetical protein